MTRPETAQRPDMKTPPPGGNQVRAVPADQSPNERNPQTMYAQSSNPDPRSFERLGRTNPARGGDRVGAEGFIYILEYSTGLVKPGRTTRPSARMSEHRGAAARHGIEITRKWVSRLHANYDTNEAILLDYCDLHGCRMGNRTEFYSGVSYDDVWTAAQQLAYPEPVEHLRQQRECAEAINALLGANRKAATR